MPTTTKTQTQCVVCGRLALKRHRHCASHMHRLTRYGDAEAMPCTYRTHVAPRFHRWILDGYRRLKDHPAMQAGRQCAERCLAFTYEHDPSTVRVQDWEQAAHVMKQLRDHGVTPEALMLRVAEMAAVFEMEPSRCPTRATEEAALGRAVVHLVRWQGPGAGQGKRLIVATARHVWERLGAWALAFVRHLNAEAEKDAELAKRAATFD
jgi:hypothetical protein